MIFPQTTAALAMRGYDPRPLETAASRAFTHAETATTGDIQQFWYAFMDAHRALYRSGEPANAER